MAPLIELEHVIDALKGFKRPLREGRQAIENLVVVGLKSRSKTEAVIEALCVRTTKISEDPVEIVVVIDLLTAEIEAKIKSISCSCPAGSSKEHCCKHGMATLLYLERNDEGKLDKLTCTDVAQKWGPVQESRRKVMSRFDPIPLVQFCHISSQQHPYRRGIKEVTKEMESEFRSMFLADQPESEAALFDTCARYSEIPQDKSEEELSTPQIASIVSHALINTSYILERAAELGKDLYLKCTPEVRNYYDKHVKISDQDAMDICLQTVEQSESDEWERRRFGKLTGSTCYEFYTYFKNKNPNWQNKIQRTFQDRFADDKFMSQDMEAGLLYEGDAKDSYEKQFDQKLKVAHPGFFNHPMTPWLGFSPDGVICENGQAVKLWENKTPKCGHIHGADAMYKNVKYMTEEGTLKDKHKYYGQVQLGMLLFALPICDFTLYSIKKDEVYIASVLLDEKFCLEMSERLTHVFFEQILPWLCDTYCLIHK